MQNGANATFQYRNASPETTADRQSATSRNLVETMSSFAGCARLIQIKRRSIAREAVNNYSASPYRPTEPSPALAAADFARSFATWPWTPPPPPKFDGESTGAIGPAAGEVTMPPAVSAFGGSSSAKLASPPHPLIASIKTRTSHFMDLFYPHFCKLAL